MSTTTLAGISPEYRHVTKSIEPGQALELGSYATLKWYEIAPPDAPVPAEIADLARQCLADAAASDALTRSTQGAVANKQVNGTPTFFINDRVVPDTVNWQQLQQALRAAGG